MCNKKLFFLFLNQNICCGYSKEPSHDGSFEYPKHIFKLMDKKIITILRYFFFGGGGGGGGGGLTGPLNTIFKPTSSISSTLNGTPARSFQTQGARCRSSGFFVLMATPSKIPKNLKDARVSSESRLGFSKYL